MQEEILLTPAALLELLVQIKELEDKLVGVDVTLDGNVEVIIGDSTYLLDCSNAMDIEVDPEVVEEVSDLNEQVYEELLSNPDNSLEPMDQIEGGVLKEIAETLLVGGVVRLGGQAVKNFMRS